MAVKFRLSPERFKDIQLCEKSPGRVNTWMSIENEKKVAPD